MKLLATLVVAALAAVVGRALGPEATGGAGGAAADRTELRAEIEALSAANARLARSIQERELLPASASRDQGVSEADIAAALARWRAAHPSPEAAPGAARSRSGPARSGDVLDLANVPMEEIVAALAHAGFGGQEQQELFQRLRDSGRIDEYVAMIERLAAEDPENPELQVALGHAYLQKLFGIGASPEAGTLAMKADAAFDRALELDDQNWGARFSKAVSLSNWPAFMGRGPEAIEQFELLCQQQEALPPRPEYAMTYLFLGNVYQANGHLEDAVEAWRSGLRQYPNVRELQDALALAEAQAGAQDDGRR